LTGYVLHTDCVVRGSGVDIALRDFGGKGEEIVLLHGGWRTLADWALVLPHLSPRHRVVSMELRCHGRSSSGPWEWSAVVDDVRAVVEYCGLTRPVIVGHSLGGMVATLCAAQMECAGAANLDGGFPTAELAARFLSTPLWVARPEFFGPLHIDEPGAAVGQTMASVGRPPQIALEASLRSLVEVSGSYRARPTQADSESIWAAIERFDMAAVLPRVRYPLLLYVAAIGERDDLFGPGRADAFAALAAQLPLVHVDVINAGHDLNIGEPARVAQRIERFVDDALSQT
jgi:pimeloyl-ACP methyl ester carboxylesterase